MSFYAKFDVHAMTIAKRIMELTLLARKFIITTFNSVMDLTKKNQIYDRELLRFVVRHVGFIY